MGTTVKQIAQSPLFQSIPLVAGLNGINGRVDFVTICNSPVLSLPHYNLDDYGFVITAFSPYYHSQEQMLEMVRLLARQHISALCVKVDAYLKEMPQILIDFCNEWNIPLFSCDDVKIPYRKIIAVVDREIFQTQVNQLENENEQYALLYDLITNGGSISDNLETLGRELSCSCAGISCDHKLLGYYDAAGSGTAALEKWMALAKRLSPYCPILREKPVTAGGMECYEYEGKLIFPCYAHKKVEGFLVVESGTDLNQRQTNALRHSVTYISAKLLENMMLHKSQFSTNYAIIDSILFKDIRDEGSIKQNLQLLDFIPEQCYRIFAFENAPPATAQSELATYAACQLMMAAVARELPSAICFYVNHLFFVLVSYQSTSKFMNDRTTKDLLARLLDQPESKTFRAAFSANQSEYKNFAECYQALRQTLRYGSIFAVNERVYAYDDFEQINIVSRILRTPQQDYVQKTIIDPIMEYDKQYQANLWDTLCVCLELDNLSASAGSLYIHTSTLRYRLQKIAALTRQDYFTPAGKFLLQVAMILFQLENKK